MERAKALLARTRPRITLGELHLEAMKLLVAALEKRTFAVTEQPRQRDEGVQGDELRAATLRQRRQRGETAEPFVSDDRPTESPRQRDETLANHDPLAEPPRRCTAHNALAAEDDFGKGFVIERRRSGRQEAFAQHQAGQP